MRVALLALALVAACKFTHGELPGASGDGGPDSLAIDATAIDAAPPRVYRITFDNSAAAVDFIGIPVLVALDATKIDYATVTDPNTDLRFVDPVTDLDIPFEVERWDPTGESVVWIRAPAIPPLSTTTSVLMHVGVGANGAANANQTFAGFELAHHLGPGFANASSASYAGTAVNTTSAAGFIGSAATFAGTGDQRITFANSGALFNQWNQMTLMFWIYLDYDNVVDVIGEPRVMDKGGSLASGRLFVNVTEIRFQVDLKFTSSNDVYLNTTVAPKTWTQIAYSFDGGNRVRIYKNGVLENTALMNGTQTMVTATNPFYLGHATNPFAGLVDELRIESRSRSPDYMRAQYLIQTRQYVTITDP